MGMQIHFDLIDIAQSGIDIVISRDTPVEGYEHSYTATIHGDKNYFVSIGTDFNNKNVWADIGSCSQKQMDLIRWLIQNRIPFNAS